MERVSPIHVLIYGPPASGKLTVAKALASRYDLALLDNHLTFDVALRLFAFGTDEFGALNTKLREVLFCAAAEARKSSVATFVYADPDDRPYVERLHQLARLHQVEVVCVQLKPPPAVLEARVGKESRSGTEKIREIEALRGALERWELYERIGGKDLSIDNSDVPPDEVAEIIAAHLEL